MKITFDFDDSDVDRNDVLAKLVESVFDYLPKRFIKGSKVIFGLDFSYIVPDQKGFDDESK